MPVIIETGFSPSRPLTHARIGHATITRTGTLVASGEQAGFEADSALNPLTYEAWKPDALPATWRIAEPAKVRVDYIAIAAHTLGSDGASVKPQWSDDDAAWNDIAGVVFPSWSLSNVTVEGIFQTASINAIFFKEDGTKLYVVGSNTDRVDQHPLTTPWDISTAGAAEENFSVAGEETQPEGLSFKSDGTKMYVVGGGSGQVRQYPLTGAWDISTAGAVEASFDVATEEANPSAMFFKSDGTKLFITGTVSDTVHQYPLTGAWDIATAGAVEETFSVATEDITPRGISFKSDGLTLYMTGSVSVKVHQYPLTTAWDISTAGAVEESFSVSREHTDPQCIFFKADGGKMYVGGSAPKIQQYSLVDDSPIMFLITPGLMHRYWRIEVTGPTPPSIGVVFMGAALAMPRPIYGGHSPIDLSRQTVIRPQRSEGGQWIGRSIVRSGFGTSFDWQHLTPAFVRDELDLFIEDARRFPFFLAWRPSTFAVAAYVWTSQDIQPSNMGVGKGLMAVSLSVEGLGVD